MTLLFVREDREYLLEPGERFESDLGILDVPDDVTAGDVVQTHLGESFTARKLRGTDLFHHLERTGAPMMPRDIGLVMGRIGVTTEDRLLDAGTGTGVLAASLARAGATITTFERDADFAEVARENMALADVADRVTVRTGDVLDHFADLGTFDAVTLDTADAPAVVERAPNLLVRGGTVAVYSPFVEDTREVVAAARGVSLSDIETVETIQREMDFDDRGSRPSTGGVGHTGYLTFARRT